MSDKTANITKKSLLSFHAQYKVQGILFNKQLLSLVRSYNRLCINKDELNAKDSSKEKGADANAYVLI